MAFMGEYRNLVIAIAEIARNDRRADFDPIVMATAIRAATDAVRRRLVNDPGLDQSLENATPAAESVVR